MTPTRTFAALSIAGLIAFAAPLPGFAEEPKGGPRAGPAQSKALTDEIIAADRAFFAALFDRCDAAALARMVTDDFEMFHDKGGRTAKSGAELVASTTKMCQRQKTGEDYRARREIIAGTEQVYPINNYGAVHNGEHRFYQLLPGKPEKLVEVARFTTVWKKEADGWRMARAISYDHRLTQ